jgi:uncharacterized protein (UPF0261 family)
LVIDVGIVGTPIFQPDVSREEIAVLAGVQIEELVRVHDRGLAITVMEQGMAA